MKEIKLCLKLRVKCINVAFKCTEARRIILPFDPFYPFLKTLKNFVRTKHLNS